MQCNALPLPLWLPTPPPSFNSLFTLLTAVFVLSQRGKHRNNLHAAMLTWSLHSSVCELADSVRRHGSPILG